MCGPLVPDVGVAASTRGQAVSLAGPPVGKASPARLLFASQRSPQTPSPACAWMYPARMWWRLRRRHGPRRVDQAVYQAGQERMPGPNCPDRCYPSLLQITGQTLAQVGTTVARPPTPPVTLGALAGMRHHPVRRTRCTISMIASTLSGWIWASGSGRAITVKAPRTTAWNRNTAPCANVRASST